jgi:hypothetical protein
MDDSAMAYICNRITPRLVEAAYSFSLSSAQYAALDQKGSTADVMKFQQWLFS